MSEKIHFENYLDKYGTLTYKNKGVSMLPMLKENQDLFTLIKKGEERCKKYDVVLYRRGSAYVLHRVIKVNSDDYVILGDNCIGKEYGIKDGDILGIMTSFVHNGKEHSCTDKGYRLYARLWLAIFPIRKLYKQCRHALGKVKRKIGANR